MIAESDDFQTYRVGAKHAARMEEIPMTATLTHAEWERAREGFMPRDMDDKWRIGYCAPYLEFYRSWTKTLVFKLHIDIRDITVHCGPLFATRDEDWYRPIPDRDETTIVKSVMQSTLGLDGFAER